jgi:hypothetical protein
VPSQAADQIYIRPLSAPRPGDDRPDETFEDRRVTVESTVDGAGVISGDLTPECAAVVTAVLEALAAPVAGRNARFGLRWGWPNHGFGCCHAGHG